MLEVHSPPGTPEHVAEAGQIEAEVERRFRRSSSIVLRNVACEYRDGVLILMGQLPSFYHKQIAQELVQQITGVRQIDNRIEIIPPDSSTWLG
jgi:osmotically-inducible protein OsmY